MSHSLHHCCDSAALGEEAMSGLSLVAAGADKELPVWTEQKALGKKSSTVF